MSVLPCQVPMRLFNRSNSGEAFFACGSPAVSQAEVARRMLVQREVSFIFMSLFGFGEFVALREQRRTAMRQKDSRTKKVANFELFSARPRPLAYAHAQLRHHLGCGYTGNRQ